MVAANKERSRDDMVRLHRGELNGFGHCNDPEKEFQRQRKKNWGRGRTGLMHPSRAECARVFESPCD